MPVKYLAPNMMKQRRVISQTPALFHDKTECYLYFSNFHNGNLKTSTYTYIGTASNRVSASYGGDIIPTQFISVPLVYQS